MATWLSAELSLVYSRLPVSELVGSFQRSSYSCRFFVLPCCFFDFVGRHCRRQSGKTQYRGYLDFISEVGSACGFRVEEDCLRIPSTRRVRPAPARPAGGAGAWGGGWRRAVSQSRTALALESTRVPDGARAGFSLRPRGSEGFSLYGPFYPIYFPPPHSYLPSDNHLSIVHVHNSLFVRPVHLLLLGFYHTYK